MNRPPFGDEGLIAPAIVASLPAALRALAGGA